MLQFYFHSSFNNFKINCARYGNKLVKSKLFKKRNLAKCSFLEQVLYICCYRSFFIFFTRWDKNISVNTCCLRMNYYINVNRTHASMLVIWSATRSSVVYDSSLVERCCGDDVITEHQTLQKIQHFTRLNSFTSSFQSFGSQHEHQRIK